jgi:hypothetical protein
MHYLDHGNAVYDSVKVRRVDRGFSGFQGKLALFETPGAKPAGEGDVSINPMALLANDPALSATPAWKAKMTVLERAPKDTAFQRGFSMTERQGLLFSTSTVTTFDATDAEMIALSMHYLVEGLRDPNRAIDVAGLKDVLR